MCRWSEWELAPSDVQHGPIVSNSRIAEHDLLLKRVLGGFFFVHFNT